MQQRIPTGKLSLPDKRYTGQKYIQTRTQTHPRQLRALVHPSQISTIKHASVHPPRTTKTRTRQLFLFGLSLFLLLSVGMSYTYYLHVGSSKTVAYLDRQEASTSLTAQGSTTEQPPSQSALQGIVQEKINQLTISIDQMRKSGIDVAVYQQQLDQARAQVSLGTVPKDSLAVLIQVANNLTSMQSDLAGNSASTQLQNFQQEVQQWGDKHKYHNPYDQKSYYLDSSYMSIDGHNGLLYGEGTTVRNEVAEGNSQAAQDIKDRYFQLSMLEANYEDTTPYNQPHQVDQALLKYFSAHQGRVLLVSLTEQALRMYNDGHLEQAFQVTTGREYRPTPAGYFPLTQHFYNLTMTSYDSPTSPDYYTPVVVRNAIQFRTNGYLIHSSQWRKDYGPFTQFPHRDTGGDPEAGIGSHGCINVAPDILSKLDPTITDQTRLIIF